MIPAWIKRVLNTQRNKRLNQRRYPRPPSTNYIDYGKIYGYEYVSSINHRKPNTSHIKSVKTHTFSNRPIHRHYDDHYHDGCSSCGGMVSTCDGDSYGSGDSSCSASSGSDGCAGGDGGCADGDGGGCGGGCGGCGGD